MRILFLGDVVGNSGCSKILNNLLSQKELNKIDFVIVNGENAAEAGVGLTKEICEDFFKCGDMVKERTGSTPLPINLPIGAENEFAGLINLVTMPSVAMNEVRVTFMGKAAHASAMPFAGINALDALVSAYQSIAQLRQHIRQNERIHGIFNEAGLAPNIVPDRAVGTFYVRAADGIALAELKTRVKNCFEAGALASGWIADKFGRKPALFIS